MPTYEYACEACGHEFEREQRITEDAIKKCPKCGKPKARRMIVGGNFILKGGGWESDLYSGPSNIKKSGASKAESKKSKPSTTTTTSSDSGSAKSDKKSSTAPSSPSTKKSSE